MTADVTLPAIRFWHLMAEKSVMVGIGPEYESGRADVAFIKTGLLVERDHYNLQGLFRIMKQEKSTMAQTMNAEVINPHP